MANRSGYAEEMGADMSHRLIDAAPSNASELFACVESLREHLLANPEEWEPVSWTNISKLSQLCWETIEGRAPLVKAAAWTGMSGKACLTPSLLDCCMRPASTNGPDTPSASRGAACKRLLSSRP